MLLLNALKYLVLGKWYTYIPTSNVTKHSVQVKKCLYKYMGLLRVQLCIS